MFPSMIYSKRMTMRIRRHQDLVGGVRFQILYRGRGAIFEIPRYDAYHREAEAGKLLALEIA